MERTIIPLVKNDKIYNLNFVLQDYDGNAVNLTGATLKLNAQKSGETSLKVEGSMSITDAEAGKCSYSVQNGDFDEAGNYNAEIEATFTVSNQVITWPDIIIKVQSDLPK